MARWILACYSSRLIKPHQDSRFTSPTSFTSPLSRIQAPKRERRGVESNCIGNSAWKPRVWPVQLRNHLLKFCPNCQGASILKSTPPQAFPGKANQRVLWECWLGHSSEVGWDVTRLHFTPKPRKAAGWWMHSTASGQNQGHIAEKCDMQQN